MASSIPKITLLTILLLALAAAAHDDSEPSGVSIAERLQSNESASCWESMMEIRSCMGEVVMFFLNGETYLGPGCCRAVRTILRDCRSSMLSSLGFTSEETHVLDDYCEGSTEAEGVPRILPPPPATVVVPLQEGLNHP